MVGGLVEIWSNLIFESALTITRTQVAAECENFTILHFIQEKAIIMDLLNMTKHNLIYTLKN